MPYLATANYRSKESSPSRGPTRKGVNAEDLVSSNMSVPWPAAICRTQVRRTAVVCCRLPSTYPTEPRTVHANVMGGHPVEQCDWRGQILEDGRIQNYLLRYDAPIFAHGSSKYWDCIRSIRHEESNERWGKSGLKQVPAPS